MYHCTTWVTVYLWSRYICSSCGTVTSSRSRLMASCDSAAKAGAVNRRSKNQESRARILIKFSAERVGPASASFLQTRRALTLYGRDLRGEAHPGLGWLLSRGQPADRQNRDVIFLSEGAGCLHKLLSRLTFLR